MPNYRWTCQLCQLGNSEKLETCGNCGHTAETTVWDTDARRFAFTHMLGGIDSFSCPKCTYKLHDISFSEDPVIYFQNRNGKPLFRNMMIYTRCQSCNHKLEKEFYVPILRRLYRKIMGGDINEHQS